MPNAQNMYTRDEMLSHQPGFCSTCGAIRRVYWYEEKKLNGPTGLWSKGVTVCSEDTSHVLGP